MTRINAGIPPKQLSDRHLLAEHREILRIPNAVVKKIKAHKELPPIPDSFCFGKGHVTFFYNKGLYLYLRYIAIREECLARGFRVQDYSDAFISMLSWAPHLYNDWRPRLVDTRLTVGRLRTKDPKYYSLLRAYRDRHCVVVINQPFKERRASL